LNIWMLKCKKMIKNRTILQGDVLEKLAELPDESIDVVITSPPYWGLRDYGTEGQWGLESDFKDYLIRMNQFMTRLKRVLKNTGTVWINLGDTYGLNDGKSRFGIPERFYIQCIDSGWIARNHIPWIKANSMPSSVKDRFTNKWESIFFFAKNQKYYFNLDAVREKTVSETRPFNVRVRDTDMDRFMQKALDDEADLYNKKGERKMANVEGQSTQGIHRNRLDGKSDWPEWNNKQDWKNRHDEQWDKRKWSDNKGQPRQGIIRVTGGFYPDGSSANNPNGKNPGDVFNINPRPFPEAHFATFPVDLPLKILKCACPENGTVLDPFFGAGTVGIAAEKRGLNWVGIELKQEYIEIARKRLYPYLNQKLMI